MSSASTAAAAPASRTRKTAHRWRKERQENSEIGEVSCHYAWMYIWRPCSGRANERSLLTSIPVCTELVSALYQRSLASGCFLQAPMWALACEYLCEAETLNLLEIESHAGMQVRARVSPYVYKLIVSGRH